MSKQHGNSDNEQRGTLPPAVVVKTMSAAEKTKYFLATMATTGGVLELMGTGFAGLCIAAAAGGTAAYFSEEIRNKLIDHLPAPKVPRTSNSALSRLAKINWWLSGAQKRSDTEELEAIEPDREEEDEPASDAGEDETEEDTCDELPPLAPVRNVQIPTAPRFKDMCSLINERRLVLCYTAKGPLFGTVEDLLSMAIVGMPGRGKTTALTFYVAQLLSIGAEVVVWDPHGSLNELTGVPGLSYIDELADIPASMDVLEAELTERRKLYKVSRQVKHPLLLLVDELPVVAHYGKKRDPRVFDTTEAFTLEARKWNCYFIGSGQSTDAEILPTRVAENLSSRIVFACSNRRASMAGLAKEAITGLLPIIRPDTPELKGVMIFDCSRLSTPVLGAIPFTTVKDIIEFLGLGRETSVSRVSRTVETGNGGNDNEKQVETAQELAGAITEKVISGAFPISVEMTEMDDVRSKPPVSDEKLEIISRMKKDRIGDADIASMMGLSGRRYKIYQQCLVYLGYRKDA